MKLTQSLTWRKGLLILVLLLLTVRIFAMVVFPLFDTTEARYGEMARLMLETGNWLTPQFDYNVPFWGKPPLHTWLSAAGIALLGVNEFALRLPHFLCGVGILLLTYRFASQYLGRESGLPSVLVLTSSLGFISSIGIVMTDTVLLLSLILALSSFWSCWQQCSVFHGRLFFAALGIGMLAKGPVAVVLVGIPLVLWAVYHRVLFKALACLPWKSGLGVFLIITLPWYLMAERATPGFLEYFLWGEHIQRFMVPGWEGDLYGSAHDEAKGTIWLFWLASAFPWSFVLIGCAIIHRLKLHRQEYETDTNKKIQDKNTRLNSYLLLWMLSPMLLFSMAGNILPAYVLPALPPLALLMIQNLHSGKALILFSSISLILLVLVCGYFLSGSSSKKSEIYTYNQLTEQQKKQKVLYWGKRPFSAQYYFNGKAKRIHQSWQMDQLIDDGYPFILASEPKDHQQILDMSKGYCTALFQLKKREVWQCNGDES